jgi:hypothetical protein
MRTPASNKIITNSGKRAQAAPMPSTWDDFDPNNFTPAPHPQPQANVSQMKNLLKNINIQPKTKPKKP